MYSDAMKNGQLKKEVAAAKDMIADLFLNLQVLYLTQQTGSHLKA